MNNIDDIADFQRQCRLEQIRRLVSDRIRKEDYSLEDFKKEYYPSDKDIEEFLIIEREVKNYT